MIAGVHGPPPMKRALPDRRPLVAIVHATVAKVVLHVQASRRYTDSFFPESSFRWERATSAEAGPARHDIGGPNDRLSEDSR